MDRRIVYQVLCLRVHSHRRLVLPVRRSPTNTPSSASLILMPRKSSAKATGQSLSFSQTLIDEYNSGIQARVVHEKDLETEHIQWLLGPDDANSPRSVGVSPAYSRTGRLPALACALDSRVLIINFHTTDPYRDGDVSRSASATLSRRRNQLEEELFCHPHCTLYAFDLAPLALSLRLHFNIHLTNAIDIQSALQVSGRSVVAAVQIVISDPSLVFSDNISSAFENMFYESNKDKDLTELVQRAWLTSYVGRYDVEEIQDLFSKAPKVDMKKFSDAVRHLLCWIDHTVLLITLIGVEYSPKNGL